MSAARRVVVVGYDGSDTSKAAVSFAARQARHGEHLVLVHSSPKPDGHTVFDAVVDELLAGTPFETRETVGSPARALVQMAREYNAAEIVVGAREIGLVRSGLGSVAGRLLKESDRPVTVVPPGFDPEYPDAA